MFLCIHFFVNIFSLLLVKDQKTKGWNWWISLYRNASPDKKSLIFGQTLFIFIVFNNIFHSHPQHMKGPLAPYPCQSLVWSVILILVIQLGIQWYLFFISLMTNDIYYIFHILISQPYIFLVQCLFKYFVQDSNHIIQGL